MDSLVLRLHQLVWSPGAHMHEEWWELLGVAPWRALYHVSSGCRRAIDGHISQQRKPPTIPVPAELDQTERSILALEPKIKVLTLALGLRRLGRIEYLLLREYRAALLGLLDEATIERLLPWVVPHATRDSAATSAVSPKQLCTHALQTGVRAISAGNNDSLSWYALSYLLPPATVVSDTVPKPATMDELFKLDKIL